MDRTTIERHKATLQAYSLLSDERGIIAGAGLELLAQVELDAPARKTIADLRELILTLTAKLEQAEQENRLLKRDPVRRTMKLETDDGVLAVENRNGKLFVVTPPQEG